MSFADGLREGRFVVALEITPPRQARMAVLLRRAGLLGAHADAINVIQRPDRQSSLEASLALRQVKMQPVWHLVNRGRSRGEIADDLAVAASGGLTQVLCLRGDHAGSDGEATPPIREVIAQARDRLPNALIGATLNQYAPDRRAVLRNLLPKLAAGASYVQTQPVFDLKALHPIAERLREASPATRIVAMAMPLPSRDAVTGIEARLRIRLPDAWSRLLEGERALAWQVFDETIGALVDAPWVDGVAIMSYAMDPTAEVGERVIAALRAAGVVEPPAIPAETGVPAAPSTESRD